jgi:hypothetical protein
MPRRATSQTTASAEAILTGEVAQTINRRSGNERQQSSQRVPNRDAPSNRDEAGLLQGAGESGDLDPPPDDLPETKREKPVKVTSQTPDIDITRAEKPARRNLRETEGP